MHTEKEKGGIALKTRKWEAGKVVQGIILFGFALYLIKLLVTGEVYNLLSPLAANLLGVTAGVLVLMSGYCLIPAKSEHAHDCGHDHGHGHDHHHDHDHASCGHHHDHNLDCGHDHDHNPRPKLSWVILAVPLVIGVTMPTQSLGASMINSGLQVAPITVELENTVTTADPETAAETTPAATTENKPTETAAAQPASTPAPAQAGQKKDAEPLASATASKNKTDMSKVPRAKTGLPGQQPVVPTPGEELRLNDMVSSIAFVPESYYDKRFKIVGFVVKPEGWPDNRFLLMRYMIAHCSADSTAVALLVESDAAKDLQNDQWVEVYGTVGLQKLPHLDSIPAAAWFQGYPYKPFLTGHEVKPIDAPKHPYLYSQFSL